jgi:hypothetical protein
MDHNEPLIAAISECESVARALGHSLGGWHPFTELMYTSLCMLCHEIAWVSRSDDEKHWLMDGKAVKQDCLKKEH